MCEVRLFSIVVKINYQIYSTLCVIVQVQSQGASKVIMIYERCTLRRVPPHRFSILGTVITSYLFNFYNSYATSEGNAIHLKMIIFIIKWYYLSFFVNAPVMRFYFEIYNNISKKLCIRNSLILLRIFKITKHFCLTFCLSVYS